MPRAAIRRETYSRRRSDRTYGRQRDAPDLRPFADQADPGACGGEFPTGGALRLRIDPEAHCENYGR